MIEINLDIIDPRSYSVHIPQQSLPLLGDILSVLLSETCTAKNEVVGIKKAPLSLLVFLFDLLHPFVLAVGIT